MAAIGEAGVDEEFNDITEELNELEGKDPGLCISEVNEDASEEGIMGI
jgi:hypothetical protein